MKEGAYRLRVSHPKFSMEVRQIQVLAGQTQEIRIRLAQRPEKASPLEKAGKAVDEGVEAVKKLFR